MDPTGTLPEGLMARFVPASQSADRGIAHTSRQTALPCRAQLQAAACHCGGNGCGICSHIVGAPLAGSAAAQIKPELDERQVCRLVLKWGGRLWVSAGSTAVFVPEDWGTGFVAHT